MAFRNAISLYRELFLHFEILKNFEDMGIKYFIFIVFFCTICLTKKSKQYVQLIKKTSVEDLRFSSMAPSFYQKRKPYQRTFKIQVDEINLPSVGLGFYLLKGFLGLWSLSFI